MLEKCDVQRITFFSLRLPSQAQWAVHTGLSLAFTCDSAGTSHLQLPLPHHLL